VLHGCLCLSGVRPAPLPSRRHQDEGQEGPRRPQPAAPGHARQEGREGNGRRSLGSQARCLRLHGERRAEEYMQYIHVVVIQEKYEI